MKFLIILFIISMLLSCSDDHDNLTKSFNNIEITFKGLKGEFHKKYNLKLRAGEHYLKEFNEIKRKSKDEFRIQTPRPVMYEIDLRFYNNEDDFYTLWVIASTVGEFSIEDKSNFYKNDELIKLVQEIIRLEEIKNHSLPLNQEIYVREILKL